nr:MAG TPA: nuclear pore complex protein [Caudoviricetes sp.]
MIRTYIPDTDTPKPDSGVDYHTVKSWFKQLRAMDDRIDRIQLDIRQAHDKATKCTASMTGMPGGSGHGDKIGLCAEETDENERKMQELQSELEVLRMEAKRRIKYIAGTKSSDMMQACLYGYYVQNQKQVVVARSLGLPNENRVSLYVRDGCKQLAQIWHQFM